MPTYIYKAKNLKGEVLEGEQDFASVGALEYMLRGKGYFLVESKAKGREIKMSDFIGKITSKDIAVFCRQFSVIINAGITILEAVEILRDQASKKRQKAVLDEVYGELQKGRILSEAVKPYTDLFPQFMQNMIRVGEAGGALDVIFDRLADYYENDYKIKRKIKSAMTYPIILAVLTVGVVILLMVAVLPMFSDMLGSMGGELPGITRVLIAISDFMVKNLLMIIAIIILIVVLISYAIRTEEGRLWFDRLKLRLPVIKTMVLKSVTARFARSMSILLKSGIPIINSMDIVCELIGNKEVESKLKGAKEDIQEGRGIAVPMRRMGIFPPLLIHMVVVGESTGELDTMLASTAGFFDDEVEEAVEKAIAMIEPMMIIVMAGLIGMIILSVMLPMVSIMDTVQ